MTPPLQPEDLDATVGPGELAALQAVAGRLERERPIPAPSFRGNLRRSLMHARPLSRPARLRLQIAAYGWSGTLLLLIGASSAAGIGPLSAS